MRSRNIKPSFFSNEHLAECSFESRLLFIALWTLADRDGRLEDRPKKIKMAAFPADNVNVDECLDELASSEGELIRRYTVAGKPYIEITNFSKHQRPHHQEKGSDIPPPTTQNTGKNEESEVIAIYPDNNATSPEKVGANPSDTLLLIPDTLSPLPPSHAGEKEAGVSWEDVEGELRKCEVNAWRTVIKDIRTKQTAETAIHVIAFYRASGQYEAGALVWRLKNGSDAMDACEGWPRPKEHKKQRRPKVQAFEAWRAGFVKRHGQLDENQLLIAYESYKRKTLDAGGLHQASVPSTKELANG